MSLAAVTLATAAAVWLALGGYDVAPFPGQFSVDTAAASGKAIVLALALLVLVIARDDFGQGAFPILLLSSLYGVCLLLSSDSFLTLFLGLELMSLPVYALVLLAYRRPETAEAALKYLVLGGTGTATLLMGVSLLYGGSGSLALAAFTGALQSDDTMARVAVMLVLVAFFLKAAIVPFHAWAPDAYEGRRDPGHGVHGHDRQGRRPARRRSVVRRRAAVAGDGRRRRAAAARCRSSGATSRRCGSRACAG